MKGLIKSDAALDFPIAKFSFAAPEQGDDQRAPLTAIENPLLSDVKRLEAALAATSSDKDRLKAAIESARHEGRQEGDAAGFARGMQTSDERHAVLKTGVERAVGELQKSLSALEHLAPLLAHAALERVLGPHADQEKLVTQIVLRQLAKLEREAVLCVDVSPEDFPGDLPAFSAAGGAAPKVCAAADLASGECRIRLRLGSLEVGPQQQWTTIARALNEFALPGGDR